MQIEVISDDRSAVRLTLSRDEIKYLCMALERATFLDTPPQHQRSIYNFASDLLHRLEGLIEDTESH